MTKTETPQIDPRDADCPKSETGFHCYKADGETWDWERRKCIHCGDTYKIYEDEMQ